jgi:hypothetical protein
LALTGAAADMGRAAESLDRRGTGAATQDAQRGAIRRLNLLLEALKPDSPLAQGESPNGGDENGRQAAQNGGIPSPAELRLLKLLQQEINIRAGQLQQAMVAAGNATAEHRRQGVELSQQQGSLADIVLQSLRPDRENPEPLVEIARQMRDVQHRMGQTDCGEATQRIQRQIVADLDGLIQQIGRRVGRGSSIASQPQPSVPRSSAAPSGPKPGSTAQKPNSKPATTSSRPPSDSRTGKSEAAETRVLMKRLWGVLPKHAREQMLQLPAEEFPPKYELQIEDYFQRLSDEGRGGEKRGERAAK